MTIVKMRDNAPLHVRTIGRGQPVLMLPGLGMNSNQWLPFVLPYSRQFRFIMPDFRGQGRSKHIAFNQSDVFQNHMEDTQDVIRHFALDDFLLVGISLGATTSLHLQREAGWDGVRGYLHIDQSPCVVNKPDWNHGLAGGKQPALFERMQAVLDILNRHSDNHWFDQLPRNDKQKISGLLSEVLGILGSDRPTIKVVSNLWRLPAGVIRRLPLMQREVLARYMAAYSGGGHDYRSSLGRDDVPVTLMIGMNSVLYAEAGQRLIAEKNTRSEVICFEHSGHVPLLSEPRKFLREFGRFLRQDYAWQQTETSTATAT